MLRAENARIGRGITPRSSVQIRHPQLIRWVANQKYPGLIDAGRRPKTSACLLLPKLLPVFFEVLGSRILPGSGPLLAQFRWFTDCLAGSWPQTLARLGVSWETGLYDGCDWGAKRKTNTETPFFPVRFGVGTGSLAAPSGPS